MRWVGVAAVGILLHGFLGCAKPVKKAPPEPAKAASVEAEPAIAGIDAAAGEPPATASEVAADTPAESTLRVQEILLAEQDGQPALIVHLSRQPDDVRHFALSGPSRVVIDVEGPLPAVTRTRTYEVGAAGVRRVRVGEHGGKLRLVADLDGAAPGYEIDQSDRFVRALLGADRGPVAEQLVYRAPDVAPAELPPASEGLASAPASEPVAAAPPPSEPSYDPAATAPPATAAPEPEAVHASARTEDELPAFAMAARDARGNVRGGRDARKTTTTEIDGGTVTIPAWQPKEFTGQHISLDFKDADIQNVLRILADVSGLNIITTEDVQGKLTMRLVNVPWDEALNSILKAKGLDMVREGNIARVSSVERLKEERDAQRAADEAQKQVEPLKVHYVRVNYAKADKTLVDKVGEVLTERGSATWDERTNTVVVRDIARGVADAEELIAQRRGHRGLQPRPRHPVGLQLQGGSRHREPDRPELSGHHQRRRLRQRTSGPPGADPAVGRDRAVLRRFPRDDRGRQRLGL
jgi:hypothetical protein